MPPAPVCFDLAACQRGRVYASRGEHNRDEPFYALTQTPSKTFLQRLPLVSYLVSFFGGKSEGILDATHCKDLALHLNKSLKQAKESFFFAEPKRMRARIVFTILARSRLNILFRFHVSFSYRRFACSGYRAKGQGPCKSKFFEGAKNAIWNVPDNFN